MTGRALVLALAGLWFGSVPGLADEGNEGFFVGLRGIASAAEMDDVSVTGFGAPPTIENDTDHVAGVALVGGYEFKELPVRAEIELAHRFRFDFDVRDFDMGSVVDYEMNVATTSALASVILEWRNDTDFTPFIGATAGWARNWTDTERIVLNTQAKVETDDSADNLAWGGTVGVDWAFAEDWVAGLAYRYIDLGEVDTGLVAGTRIEADDHVSHDVLLSVAYRF